MPSRRSRARQGPTVDGEAARAHSMTPALLSSTTFGGEANGVRYTPVMGSSRSAHQLVEALRILSHDLAARFLRQRRESLSQFANDAKGRIDVWIVGSPDEVVGAEVLDHLDGERLVRIRRDQTLPVEVRAGWHADRRLVRHDTVLVVEPVEPGGNPVRARLQHGALQARIALEHAGAQHLSEGGHDVDGQEGEAEEPVRWVTPQPLPEPLAVAHDDVEGDRHLEVL